MVVIEVQRNALLGILLNDVGTLAHLANLGIRQLSLGHTCGGHERSADNVDNILTCKEDAAAHIVLAEPGKVEPPFDGCGHAFVCNPEGYGDVGFGLGSHLRSTTHGLRLSRQAEQRKYKGEQDFVFHRHTDLIVNKKDTQKHKPAL